MKNWKMPSLMVLALSASAAYALTPKDFSKTGAVIDRIQSAHTINGFSYLDNQHMLLSVGPKRHYLLNFRNSCHHLAWADKIDISKSGDTIHAGFDYVTVAGARCEIGEIRQITQDEMIAITWNSQKT